MDPAVVNALSAGFAHLGLTTAQSHQERVARQSDATQIDNRGLNAAVFKSMVESDLAEIVGGLNTASHVPTSQPWVTPPWVSSGFKPA